MDHQKVDPQTIIDMMLTAAEEIRGLRRRIALLYPKAEAYDMIRMLLLGRPEPGGAGEDVAWQLEHIAERFAAEPSPDAPKGVRRRRDEMVDERMAHGSDEVEV